MSGSVLRVVLLGKTGTGKSSLGNTLFGDDVFQTDDSANSGTHKCQAETRDVDGRSLTLIDTPGFFDTYVSEKQHKNEVMKCITECAPGPHAFLILLKVERFTPLEKEVIEKILKTFSEEAFKYAIIVLTHGDQLRKGMTIETFVQQSEGLRDLVSRCGGRCHVFDNRYWNQQDEYRSNQFQRGELFTTIDKMVEEHHGGCYTNEMLQQVETMILSLEEIREEAKEVVYKVLKVCAGVSTGVLLGALLGVPIMVGMAVSSFRKAGKKIALTEFVMPTLTPLVAAAAKNVLEKKGHEVEEVYGGAAAPGLLEAVASAPSEAAAAAAAAPGLVEAVASAPSEAAAAAVAGGVDRGAAAEGGAENIVTMFVTNCRLAARRAVAAFRAAGEDATGGEGSVNIVTRLFRTGKLTGRKVVAAIRAAAGQEGAADGAADGAAGGDATGGEGSVNIVTRLLRPGNRVAAAIRAPAGQEGAAGGAAAGGGDAAGGVDAAGEGVATGVALATEGEAGIAAAAEGAAAGGGGGAAAAGGGDAAGGGEAGNVMTRFAETGKLAAKRAAAAFRTTAASTADTIATTLAAAAGVAAVGGAAAGGCVGYAEANKVSTIVEAAGNTASKVWDMTNESFQL